MPFQSGPSEDTKKLVARMGGSMWTTCTDVAAGGAATARAQIENMYVPDTAKMLLGWRPVEYAADQAVSESLMSVFDISGGNYNYQPQEVICGNVGIGILTDAGGILHAPSEYYDVFAPVSGGAQISIGVEPLDAIAGNRRSGAEFTWTDRKLPLPVIRSRCSREVAINAAGVTPGTTLNITNAHELIEVGGVITEAAPTIEEEAFGTLVIKCTALPINEIKCLLEPCGAIADLGTDEGPCGMAYLARRVQRLKFSSPAVTVLADFDLDVALSNAGQAAHYLRWI